MTRSHGAAAVLIFAAAAVHAAAPVGPERLGTYVAGGRGLYAPIETWKRDAEQARRLGFGVVRFNSDVWDLLEPAPGRYDWRSLDAAVDAVRGAGLEILFTLPISSK